MSVSYQMRLSSFATSGVQVLRLALVMNRMYSSLAQGPPITIEFISTNSRAHRDVPQRSRISCSRSTYSGPTPHG